MHPIDGRRYAAPATLSCAALSYHGRPQPTLRLGAPCSAADGALRFDVERIDRLARRHEESVALGPAETDVGAALGQEDTADQHAVGGEDSDPVLTLAAGKPGPDIALCVAANAVGVARHRIEEHAPIGDPGAVIDDIIDMGRIRSPARGVDDIEPLLVGGKSKTVGPPHVTDRDRCLASGAVDPIDPVGQLRRRLVAEIIAANAGAVVAEPDRAVGLDDDIVWASQLLAVEAFGEHRDRAVVLGAG